MGKTKGSKLTRCSSRANIPISTARVSDWSGSSREGRTLNIPLPMIATPMVMIFDLSPGLPLTIRGRHFGLGFGFDSGSGSASDDVNFLLIQLQVDGHH